MSFDWKLILFISIGFLFSCNTSKQLSKTWQYLSVTKNNQSLFQITQNDTMMLSDQKKFRYDIALPDKHESGIWFYKKDTLFLTYYPNNTVRKFKIEKLNRHKLSMRENDITFNYKKR